MAPPSQPPPHPTLTPQLCLAPNSLRAFLRLSRVAIDDPVSQHLNSLSHPSTEPFDTSSISAARPAGPSRRGLPPATCAGFVSHTLFPAWAARARVLEYCAGVAERETARSEQTTEGAEGGGGRGGQWGGTIAGGTLAIGAGVVGPEAEQQLQQQQQQNYQTQGQTSTGSQRPSLGPDGQAWSSPRTPRVVDERLDPYSARNYSDETAGERLTRVIKEERLVESIVRARSWGVVKDRCGAAIDGWEEAMTTWESEVGKAQSKMNSSSSSVDPNVAEQNKKKPGWIGIWS